MLAPRALLAEPFGRFGLRVVALRVVPPEPVSVAALDLPRDASAFVRAARRSDVVPRFVGVLDLAWLDLPPGSSAVAGAVRPLLGVLAARLFDTRRPASGFLGVDVRVEWLRVAVRAPLAGTSVISTSPRSDTGRSGTKRPSSSAPNSPSSAS